MKAQIENIFLIGDRVLIKPEKENKKSKGGLYLPAGYQQNELVCSGFVIRTGPGYPVAPPDDSEPWKSDHNAEKYIPLQVKPGDLAIFLQKNAIEVEINNEKYFVVIQNHILLVERIDY